MGKLKDAVIEAEQFAQEWYNVSREEFFWQAQRKYGFQTTMYRVAMAHWEEIQKELNEHFNSMEN